MQKSKNYYQLTAEQVLSELGSSVSGLKSPEVETRQLRYGYNILTPKEGISPLWVFLKQFHNGLIYILLLAALISALFQHWVDMWIIVIIVGINGIIGFIQEYRAEKSVAALAQKILVKTKVYRDGVLQERDAHDLVPGDIIILEEGDKIPADARLIEATELQTTEASLTGESNPVHKSIESIPHIVGIGDRINSVWMGTLVATGWAKAVVVAIGEKTAVGSIATDIDAVPVEQTHFHKQTAVLSRQLGLFAFISSIIIFIIGFWFRQLPLDEMISFTLSTLVGGIPESLPVVLIVVLAIGAKRMSDRKAIIRSFPVTESLAVMDTIITDKTGTLTENNMTAQKIWVLDQDIISIMGQGLSMEGDFLQNDKVITPLDNPAISQLIHIAGLAHNGRVYEDMLDTSHQLKSMGDPTEVALGVMSVKGGLKKEALDTAWKRLLDLPFRSDNKYRASYVHNEDLDKHHLMVIGASEKLLSMSSHILDSSGKSIRLTQSHIDKVSDAVTLLSRQAMRVIALAYQEHKNELTTIDPQGVKNLVFVGLVGIIDPPRMEVKESILQAQRAGIRVIMATGDHKDTALAIAQAVGVAKKGDSVLEESDLVELSDTQLYAALKHTPVLARLSPHMKLRVAEVLQKHHHIVAMTGDGVNDAPALKKADIGIAMGIRGTDVAREASDIVLTDDNFVSIVSAVEEGRVIFRNVQQTSLFLVTSNIATIMVFILCLALGYSLPLIAIQVLCLNLVTNGISDIALATERSHRGILLEPPLPVDKKVISKDRYMYIIVISITMIIIGFGVFLLYYDKGIEQARTMFFWSFASMQLANTYNMRSPKESLFSIGFFSNKMINLSIAVSILILAAMITLPFLQRILQFTPVSIYDSIYYGIISIVVVIAVAEVYKWWDRLEGKY
jgi:P-type Ca2+ transporter type 2C